MSEKPVILLGAGGHAKVLLDALLALGVEVLGIAEKDGDNSKQKSLYDIPVIGTDSDVQRYSAENVELVNGIGSVGPTFLREKVYQNFKNQGYKFRQVIHPNAVVSPRAKLGEGVQVMPGAVINISTVIGENSIINTRASVDHDCVIGAHVHIAPGVTVSGGVTVGDGSHIGTGATVVQGVVIGQKVFVEAGAVVMKNLQDEDRMKTFRGEVVKR